MDKKILADFLVKAKLNTYAASGENNDKIFPNGSKIFKFEEKKIKYQDRYFGFNPFIGEEIVWKSGKIIWGMNYYGKIISKEVSEKQIYQFLREALKKITKNSPFRGPDSFNRKDLKYFNQVNGDIKNFMGKEKIFYNNKLTYILTYHGGFIKIKDNSNKFSRE